MFLIISFDNQDTSSVVLECMTNDLQKANKKYDTLLQSNKKPKELIELVEVSEDFSESFCFFWGDPTNGVKILCSNNRN